MDDDHLDALLDELEETNPLMMRAFYLTCLVGGRRGEVAALRWTDVDFDAGTVAIQRGVVRVGSGRGWIETKYTKDYEQRVLALSPDAMAMLRTHRNDMRQRTLACGTRLRPNGFVFSDAPDCSTFWLPERFTATFRRTAEWLGIRERADGKRTRFHDLRAYFATRLLDNGVAVHDVQRAMGHGTLAVTQKYAHATDANPAIPAALAQVVRARG